VLYPTKSVGLSACVTYGKRRYKVSKKMPDKKELIAHGYMTPGDFVDRLVPGLKEYLKHNWGCKPDELYHPEDLFSNAEIYLEVARHVVGDFGVAPHNKA
jgi:hypothetical protein